MDVNEFYLQYTFFISVRQTVWEFVHIVLEFVHYTKDIVFAKIELR